MKIAAIVAATAISLVAAQSPGADEGRLYYSEPVGSTVWTAGGNHTVSWTNVCRPENPTELNVVLYLGGAASNEQVRVPGISAIGKVDCKNKKSGTVVLPANLTTSNKYSIHVDTDPLQSYSAQFTINGIAPPVSSVAPPSVVAPTTAAATAVPSGGATADAKNAAGSLKVIGSSAVVLAAAVGSLFL